MKKIKGILTRNIGLKILSFLLAALIWVSIMNYDDPYITETISGIKVEVINENALGDKIYAIESGRTVSITVRGKRKTIDSLKASDFAAVADFTQLSLVNAVPINVFLNPDANDYTEEDAKIQTQQPVMMTLTMEERIEGLFNIETIVMGEVEAGYYLKGININTAISLKATSKQLAKISRVVVEVDVTGADGSFTQNVYPTAYDENGEEIDPDDLIYEYDELLAYVEVLPTKEILIVASKEGEPPDGYVCTDLQTPMPKTVIIAGTEEELASIAAYFLIPIDVTGFTETTDYVINIEDALKERFSDKNYIVIDNKNLNVRVWIEKLEEKEIMVKTSLIELRNIKEGYKAMFLMGTELKLKVRGLTSVLDEVTAESLQLYVDLQGMEPGSNNVYILSDTKADIEVNSPMAVIQIYKEQDLMEQD